MKIRVTGCYDVTLPAGTGLLHKRILIPPTEYTDEQIRYILLHEYMHFRNKDLLIRMLVEIFVRIFWWNPFVYLLKADIQQIIEIKCDLSVISDMNRKQRADYLLPC